MNKVRQGIGADCPNCQRTYEIRDLDKFLDYKLTVWRIILSHIKSSYNKQNLIGSLAVCSAIETLNKEIDENGELVATCLPCMIEILKKIHKSNKLTKVECIIK
jgi:hypothetical protein